MPEEEDVEEEAYEDFEDLEPQHAPAVPPLKPLSIVNFFIERNREEEVRKNPYVNESEIREMLRKKWKEELGKSDLQYWKREHKKATKEYEKLLELYARAHPDFDKEAYNASQATQSNKQNKNKNKKNKTTTDRKIPSKRKGSGGSGGYGTKRPGNDNRYTYDIITFSDGEGPPSKRRRLNTESGGSGGSPEDVQMADVNEDNATRANNTQDSLNSNKKPLHLFEELVQDEKNSRRRMSKQDDYADDATKAALEQLMRDMTDAAKKDWQCNIEKKPATHMILMLDQVKTELQKKRYFKLLLDEGLLERLRDWLHPFPDGSLPPQKIRDVLLPIIQAFPLHKEDELSDYLNTSAEKARDPSYEEELLPNRKGFAETMMNLWASKHETKENKQLLHGMINKWLYKIENANIDYGELRDELGERRAEIMQRQEVLQRQKQEFNLGPRKRARVPEKAWFDFAVIPRAKVDESENGPSANREGTKKSKFASLDQRLQKQKKNATAKKTGPSVTGRLNPKG